MKLTLCFMFLVLLSSCSMLTKDPELFINTEHLVVEVIEDLENP